MSRALSVGKGGKHDFGARSVYHEFNLDIELALGALAVYNPKEAVEYLYEVHDIETTEATLDRYRRRFPQKYQEIREKLAPQIEGMAVTDIRDNIARVNLPINLAIERAHKALEEGRVSDPSKIGEQLANIQSKQKDTMMALQGRPAVVKEVRNVDEILRALQAISPDLVIEDAEEVGELDAGAQ